MGGKITPSAVLVIQNGTTKLVNIKNQDGITKVLDMVPDFVNRFTGKKEESNSANDAIVDEDAKRKREMRWKRSYRTRYLEKRPIPKTHNSRYQKIRMGIS